MTTVIEIDGASYEVDYEYQPYEPMELEYPGCPEGVDIHAVRDKDGDDVTEELDDDDVYTKTFEAFKDGRDDARLEAYLDHQYD
mgnify:CR=1 FL=1|tara:strand:- start:226 stop:477 length:252 start_codon:yes stop_codon:yes gene_type:complete